MKLFTPTLLLLTTVLLSACGSNYKLVSFEKMRTPLNPIAHKGINEYTPVVHLEYAEQPLREQEAYNREVQRRTESYKSAMIRYENTNAIERVTQGLVQPELILPDPPVIPYMMNKHELESKIVIDGMQRSQGNGLIVNLYLEGFSYRKVTISDTVKKSVTDGVQKIDSVFSATAEVAHPVRLSVVAPNGDTFNDPVLTSRNYKNLKSQNYASRHQAENKIYELIQNQEKTIVYDHIQTVNQLLNSQFGTKLMPYTVNLYQFQSDKHDYSDLESANVTAQIGFKQLHENPNKAYENLAQAYGIWQSALNGHSSHKKARINDEIKQGLLINLYATAIYTDNWNDAMKYAVLLENTKLKGPSNREFFRLKSIHDDLKKRYDVIRQ